MLLESNLVGCNFLILQVHLSKYNLSKKLLFLYKDFVTRLFMVILFLMQKKKKKKQLKYPKIVTLVKQIVVAYTLKHHSFAKMMLQISSSQSVVLEEQHEHTLGIC